MRKEILFAVISGSLFGLIIAFGIWKATSSLKKAGHEQENNLLGVETLAPESSTNKISLTLAKPEENEVFSQNPIILSGVTESEAWVSISGENEDYIIRADQNGSFEQKITLVSGVNELIATAHDQSGDTATQKILSVFSEKFGEEK